MKDKLREVYHLTTFRDKLLDEFAYLQQDTMTVTEYKAKPNKLGALTPSLLGSHSSFCSPSASPPPLDP